MSKELDTVMQIAKFELLPGLGKYAKQDNPHAKGLSVKDDTLNEYYHNRVDKIAASFNEDWIGEDAIESTGPTADDLKEARDWLFDRLCEVMRSVAARIHAHKNYRSGLALTNPEE